MLANFEYSLVLPKTDFLNYLAQLDKILLGIFRVSWRRAHCRTLRYFALVACESVYLFALSQVWSCHLMSLTSNMLKLMWTSRDLSLPMESKKKYYLTFFLGKLHNSIGSLGILKLLLVTLSVNGSVN